MLYVGNNGKYANVLSSFSLKGSREGFRSDRLNHLIVCVLPQQFVWWKVNSYMLARRKACKTFPVLERKGDRQPLAGGGK